VERLLNVIMTIGSRRRIDREKLFTVISDYAGASSDQAAERMFERDKASILDLGLPLRTERDVLDENTVYYRIDSARSAAVLDLTTQEYTVLLAASRAWDDAAAGGAARRVRSKLLSLGHDADPDLLRRTPRGAVESLPVLSPLLEAVTAGTTVRFVYRGTGGAPAERIVEPWVVGVHDGHWYVHGWDRDRQAPRVFRASRIESYPSQAGAATHPRPEQVDLSDVLERIDASDDQHVAQLRAAPYKALELRDRAGAALDAEQFELPRMPRPAARRLVLGSVRWLELTSPGPWREELAAVLDGIAASHEGEGDLAPVEVAAPRPAARIRTPSTGTDHLSRLISVASYVMNRGEVDLSELAGALGVSEKTLITDLQVLFVCGDMGTGWEDFIEAEWEHGTVRVRNAEPLRRPLRLSSVEITALLAGLAALEPTAGQAAHIVAGAREKLLAAASAPEAAGGSSQQAAGESAESGAPAPTDALAAESAADRTAGRAEAVLSAVQTALRTPDDRDPAAQVMIRYSAPDRPGTSVRRIRPLRIETDGVRSYLLADCEQAGAQRRFRLDRIVELPPDEAEQHLAESGPGPDLSGRVEGPVWLRLEPPARWIAESFDAAEIRDGRDGDSSLAYVRMDSPVRAALIDAVLESAGSAEVLAPRELRDMIVTVTRAAAARHGSPDALP